MARALTRHKLHTIRDIAAMAGVSRSTVSLALNDSPRINSKTKQEVLELIERVGYRPNRAARNLVSRSSGVICVILPRIDHVVSDFYFSESLSGVLEALTQRGFHLLVEVATEEFKRGGKALKLYREGAMEGVLCVGNLTTDDYLVQLAGTGCPVVLVNSALNGVPNVIGANTDAAYRAVVHLNRLGHTRIAHIRGSEFVTTAVDRTTGYLKAVDELNLAKSDKLIGQGYFDQQSGYEAMKWLLSNSPRPTAVFATNDMMAIGAMHAIEYAGLRIPNDVAVFGGDDILLCQYVRPRLSTMRQSMFSIAQTACEKLFDLIEQRPIANSTEIPLDLVIRESCGGGTSE